MGHPTVENRTPFAFAATYLTDEDGRLLVVPIIRATYEIRGPKLVVAEKQEPVPLGGELWGKGADTSSYKYEPEVAFVKPGTDLVLIGHACAPRRGVTEMDVGFQVGRVGRTARIIGDRVWTHAGMTRPQPFERMPLLWERAFGGADLTAGTKEKPAFEARNPVGRGYRSPDGAFQEGIYLPNIEDPSQRLASAGDVVTPVGFGFTSANWQPRAALAGTYDDAWMKDRMPLLPKDFDRRFFNAGAPGLVAKRLVGNEPVSVVGASPLGDVSFSLPGVVPPTCRIWQVPRPDVVVDTQLDTVVVNLDEDRVYLTFRGSYALRNGPHDVKTFLIESVGLRAPKAANPEELASITR